jgi:hypothetical protein
MFALIQRAVGLIEQIQGCQRLGASTSRQAANADADRDG